jgi:hypothetical protein
MKPLRTQTWTGYRGSNDSPDWQREGLKSRIEADASHNQLTLRELVDCCLFTAFGKLSEQTP